MRTTQLNAFVTPLVNMVKDACCNICTTSSIDCVSILFEVVEDAEDVEVVVDVVNAVLLFCSLLKCSSSSMHSKNRGVFTPLVNVAKDVHSSIWSHL